MSEQENTENGQPEAQAFIPDHGPDRDEMAANYLPGEDDWLAKTILDLNDPHAVAALRQFDRMFPEVDNLQPLIDEFIDDFLKGRTSVRGESREEYEGIIKAMFGGGGEDGHGSTIRMALGADDEE